MVDISDEKLVKRYVKGDLKALDALVERYKKPLFSFFWGLTKSKVDVDELFQETWFRVIRKASDFEQNSFKGWIFKIAHNLVIDGYRSQRGHLSLDQASEYEGGLQTLGDTIPATGIGPDDDANNHDLRNAITQALDKLPSEQREVFVLRMEVDMSFKNIAEIQGTSTNTALARMQYALSKMRKLLKSHRPGPERNL
ncbi:MAG: sigma-70 family RNA polymerase sigma factor [bacterium]